MNIKDYIRQIPDFPKPGILFYDISTLLAHPDAWQVTMGRMANAVRAQSPDVLVGIESRGFLVAAPLALQLGLGFVMVRNLVLGNGVSAAFKNVKGLDLPQFWQHNLYTASAARWLSAHAGLNADLVFTVGLMHGIGQLHLHAAATEAAAQMDRQLPALDANRAAQEQAAWGFHNGAVAAGLARVWQFPEPISLALSGVVEPLAQPEFSAAAAAVHLGGWCARKDMQLTGKPYSEDPFPQEVAARLGLSQDLLSTEMPQCSELTDGLQSLFE